MICAHWPETIHAENNPAVTKLTLSIEHLARKEGGHFSFEISEETSFLSTFLPDHLSPWLANARRL